MMRTHVEDSERGAIAVFAVVIVLGLLTMVGLVVDGGGKVRALQQAEAVAAEAARAGGQAVQDVTVYQGGNGPVRIDPQQARAAALRHVRAAGMTGQATVTPGATRVQVSATTTYQPVFLGLIGIGTQTVTGDGEAELTQVLDGNPQ
jgi:Flp pilus assembly protein TadG